MEPADEAKFFKTRPAAVVKDFGTVVVQHGGKEFRVGVKEALRRWVRIPGTPLQLRVDEYLPYAVVEKNRLVTKSDEPVNPAVQLRIRGAQEAEETHSVFANFPEFATLHGAHLGSESGKANGGLGVKLRLLAGGEPQSLMGVGRSRGRLRFALSADGRRLLYVVLGPRGDMNAQGEVKDDAPIVTGWMDLRFRIPEWYPAAVTEIVPKSVDYIGGAGGETNFISAAHVTTGKEQAWLIEGTQKMLSLGDRRLAVYYGRDRLSLPFTLFLDKFTIGNDPGTTKAAAYESDVTLKDPSNGVERKAKISMNEPLDYGGYTFYQASYQMQEGQPPISVLAVNYDPGRRVKYFGALIMVLGILVMFYMNPQYLDKMLGRRST